MRSETEHEILADFTTIAHLLKLPEATLQKKESLLRALMEWFRTHSAWLLILDNADHFSLVEPFVPQAAPGHLLLTTRTHAAVMLAQPLELEALDDENGALCLLRRSGYLQQNQSLHQASRVQIESAQKLSCLMGGLPLALEQAGAYIEATDCGVSGYLRLYEHEMYRTQIQQNQQGEIPNYPAAVAHTWTLAREIAHQHNPATTDLLSLCAFLAPEAIPGELFSQGASALNPALQQVVSHPPSFHHVIATLLRASLLQREADRERDTACYSLHRVMQDILKAEMNEGTQKIWAERAVTTVALTLPVVLWLVIQPHVEQCVAHIHHYAIQGAEAEQLVHRLDEADRS